MLAFEARHPDRSVRVVYGDLCAQPESVLTEALAKLNLAFEPAMLAFAEQDHNFGLEDPVVRGTKAIRISTDNWQVLNKGQRDRLMETFGELMSTDLLCPTGDV
jgi:hypothetical protein